MRSDDMTPQEAILAIIVTAICIGMCLGIFLLSGNGRLVW